MIASTTFTTRTAGTSGAHVRDARWAALTAQAVATLSLAAGGAAGGLLAFTVLSSDAAAAALLGALVLGARASAPVIAAGALALLAASTVPLHRLVMRRVARPAGPSTRPQRHDRSGPGSTAGTRRRATGQTGADRLASPADAAFPLQPIKETQARTER